MADQTAHHVVNSNRSTAEQLSVDAHANQSHIAPAAPGTRVSPTASKSTATAYDDAPTTYDQQRVPSPAYALAGMPSVNLSAAEDERPSSVAPSDVNGGQDSGSAVEDGLGAENVGSDTDTSRTGSIDQSKEENRHLRSNSSKKPTSFKAVSVTKTFLAKTAGAAPAPPKVGSKSPVASTLQPVAKPRLVAKSGSGLRDIPRVRSHDGSGAPDGRMVWNKNQPVPPPPPKQFTDEELKQQYGIHLASRLQEDEDTGKSKWADEDDDEEDWAPEAVEWMDGTKSTIIAADQQAQAQAQAHTHGQAQAQAQAQDQARAPAQPQPQPQAQSQLQAEPRIPAYTQGQAQAQGELAEGARPSAEAKAEEQSPATKPTLTALKRPAGSTSTTTKTILRPGAAQQAKQSGIGLNGSLDKQTLVAKANPTPVKSPWAPLPPIDKTPLPVVNPPTMSQHPARFGNRDPHSFEAFSHQSEPAREIAADTFDRSSWRDSERANRELFNSQSGRYEPVPDHRRGSRQPDNFRQPAVLQRASHQAGASPAEPSAAFQTRSAAQMDGSTYSRRRGSSVSGGSNFSRDRRMSTAKAPDLPPSQDDIGPGNAAAPVAGGHPPHDAQPSAHSVHADVSAVQPVEQQPEPVSTLEDEVARQKKVLQESREAAKKRKQEEWDREEAERKERIRKKLEALSEQTARPSPPATQPTPQSSVITNEAAPASPDKISSTKPVEQPSNESPDLAVQEPHTELPASSPKHTSPRKQRLPEPVPASFGQSQSPFSRAPPKATFEEPQLPGLKQQSPQLSTRTPYQRQPSAHGVTGSNFSSPGDHKVQPTRMQGMPGLPNSDSFALWGSGGMPKHPTSANNVWGPPTNNRGIGNGTFDTGYTRMGPSQLQQHQAAPFSSPAPFGRQYPQRISPPGFAEQQLGQTSNLETRLSEPSAVPQINGTSPLPETARPAYQPAPIAPPQKIGARSQHPQARDTSAWTSFAMQAQTREREEAVRLAAERRDQPKPQQQWTETFKQTQMEDGWLGGPRRLIHTEKTVHGGDMHSGPHSVVNPAPPVAQTSIAHQITSPGSSMNEHRHMPGESTVRLPTGPSNFRNLGSPASTPGNSGRVTPLAGNTGPPPPAQPMTPTSAPQQSRFFPSALYGGSPPPEEADHPVFGGNAKHPHVKLPSARPKVKLPPAQPASPDKTATVIMPQRSPSFRVGAQPLVATHDWQARFNGLFGRAQISTTTPPSPPKTPPRAHDPSASVAAASKAAMDFSSVPQIVTTVSLPRTQPQRFEAISKPGVDDIFNGELSFGSTPRVFLPKNVQYPEVLAGGHQTPVARTNSKFSKHAVESRSKAELPQYILHDSKSEVIRMKLPQAWAIAREIPFQRRQKSSINQQGRKASTKVVKSKRAPPGAHAVTADEPSKTASPSSYGPDSRKSSFQKTQTPTPDVPTKSSPLKSGQANGSDENAPKRSTWAKPPKGAPRGRNPTNKPHT